MIASSLRHFRKSRNSVSIRQLMVMVAPRGVAAEIQKRREDAKSRQSGPINSASLQIIGSGLYGSNPSLMVQSEGRAYLFNCSEGLQRNCNANKIKLTNLEHVFLTHSDWSKIAGAYGLSLTLQDIGIPKLTINSTESLARFFTSARSFLNFYNGSEGRTYNIVENKFYQDPGITIRCIPIETCDRMLQPKRRKCESTLVAYHCTLPDLPGALDPQRCKDLNVPVGPKLGLLKSGKDIELDDGTVIKSTDVCGPRNLGMKFLVVDCPSASHMQSFVDEPDLSTLRQHRDDSPDLVIHFSPSHVTMDPLYTNWMDGFREDCKHILISNQEPRLPNFIDSYRLQYLLRQLDREIFPELDLPAHISNNQPSSHDDTMPTKTDETDLKTISMGQLEDQERMIHASTFDKVTLRPSQIYETTDSNMLLDSVFNQAKLEENFDLEYGRYNEVTANLREPAIHEPEVVFLGTGSALPSKLRNTSCILVNFTVPNRSSVILDCGEDSYGQLVRFYGLEKSRDILRNLRMIYISHHHADHHIGLIELLRRRSLVTQRPLLLLIPASLENHLDYHNDEFEDLSTTYTIITTKNLQRDKKDLHLKKPDLLNELDIVAVDHCHGSCAAIFEFNICRPGMKTFRLAYSGDARPSDEFALKGMECDLLIHEATFDHRDKAAAIEKKHSTTDEAIQVAKKMKAKFTILTHFSQRYPKIPYFTEDFDDTIGFAFDNMAVRCPSHLKRIPMMKGLLRVIFAKSLAEIDDRYKKVSLKIQRSKNSARG